MRSDEMIEIIKIKVQEFLKFLEGYDHIGGINIPIKDIKKYSSRENNKFGSFINKLFIDKVEIVIPFAPMYSMIDAPVKLLIISYSELEKKDLESLYKKLFE